ncbi:PQQ-like beta-propeller repeat protein [candidate division WOR-3 bacterium]|nr:PQQ-like beta-propeller repeat protein [candidate division WOR-3 bacterium]
MRTFLRLLLGILVVSLSMKGLVAGNETISLELLDTIEDVEELSKIVPEENFLNIQKAVANTFVKAHPGGTNTVSYSRSGEYKIIKSYLPDFDYLKSDVAPIIATLIDKTGKEIWKGEAYLDIFISNNGRNFVSIGLGSIYFYDISLLQPIKTWKINFSGGWFSDNGEHFLAWSSKDLSLFTANGKLLWKREFTRHGGKKAIISSQGSYIAINDKPSQLKSKINDKSEEIEKCQEAEMDEISERIKDILKNEGNSKDTESERYKSKEQLAMGSQPIKLPPSNESHFTLLWKDGTIIKEILVNLPYVHMMAFSPDNGKYIAIGSGNRLLFFDTKRGELLWKYEVGQLNYWISDISMNRGTIALGVIIYDPVKGGPSQSQIELINLQGRKNSKIAVPSLKNLLPRTCSIFSENGKYLVCRTPDEKISIFEIIVKD